MADAVKEEENFAEGSEESKSQIKINTDSILSDEVCQAPKQEQIDEELSELLDSALEDFSKPAVINSLDQSSKQEATAKPTKSETVPSAEAEVQSSSVTWSDEFLQQATAQFQDAVKALAEEDPKAAEDVKKFAELATKAATEGVSESDFTASLTQALKGLADNAELLSQNPIPLSEDDIANMFTSLGTETGTDSSIPDITNLMQSMMQNLLSKELLYPVLQDITDKYPDWLAENRSKLETEQYVKYNTQFHLMKQVCDIFEQETETDSDEVKHTRFVKVLGLMQKMQDCGQPPAELVGDKVPGVEFDDNGIPKIPGFGNLLGANSDQCKLM